MEEIDVARILNLGDVWGLKLVCTTCGCFCHAVASPKLPNRHTGFLTVDQLEEVAKRATEHPHTVKVYIPD